MILKEEEIDKTVLAGKIASKAITYGKSLIKPEACLVDTLDCIEKFIKDNGGEMAFPAQIAINEIAAHECPLQDDTTVFKSTDIIKLDLGVHIDGLIADTAVTIIFSDNNEKYEDLRVLKKASEEALNNTLNIIRPGITLGEIGLMIQETISNYDLSPIKNLSGHGLGKYSVHEHPTIPNFSTNDKTELKENQLVAIEPFATNGHGMIFESNNATLFSIQQLRPVRGQFTREILKDIQIYKNLPFTTRWLTKKHSLAKIRFALTELRNLGSIIEYPPLIETNRGLVSQSEHTIIVRDKPIITTRREDE